MIIGSTALQREGFSALLNLLLAICSVSWFESFSVVPCPCPSDTDECSQAALGALLGLTAPRQDT